MAGAAGCLSRPCLGAVDICGVRVSIEGQARKVALPEPEARVGALPCEVAASSTETSKVLAAVVLPLQVTFIMPDLDPASASTRMRMVESHHLRGNAPLPESACACKLPCSNSLERSALVGQRLLAFSM